MLRADGWGKITLDQVASQDYNSLVDGPFGSNLKMSEYTSAGVRLIQLQNIGEGVWIDNNQRFIPLSKSNDLSRHTAYPGDIAIAKMADPVARACIIPPVSDKFLVVADCIKLSVNLERYDPRFIVHAINHLDFRRQAEDVSTGTTRQRINLSALRKITLWVPSLTEQNYIADMFDDLDMQSQQTEQLIAKLKHQREGLLHDLLTCGLDEDGALRDPDVYQKHSRTRMKEVIFPDGWKLCPLGSIAQVGSGITLGRKLNGPDTVELPYLRVANVQNGYLDLSEMKTVRVLKDEISRFLLLPGDVLMTEGGDFDKLGRGAVWKGQIDPCLHQNHIFKVRPDTRYLLPEFLNLISGSWYGRHFFTLSSKQSTNLASINSTQLKSFPIPCPPITEQEKILDMVNAVEAYIGSEQSDLAKLKHYKQGLMHDLLTGNVRVGVGEDQA